MDEAETRLLWEYAAQAWPNYPVPPTPEERRMRVQVWRDMLGDLDAGLVRAALAALSGSDFFPPLGVVRERATALVAELAGEPPIPDVDEAWREVTTAFGRIGRYATPVWSHPAIGATVDAIRWQEMCDSTDQGVLRGQFARLYGVCRDRIARQAVPAPPAVAAFLGQAVAAVKRVDDLLELDR
jgi:hypothetical protein